MIVATYSFADVVATLSGPGGVIAVGNDSAAAEEGIDIEKDEANTMTKGADGSGMHSMHAWEGGKVTIRLLKTSPLNAALSALYRFQKSSSLNWGKNTITLNEIATGDVYTCEGLAFQKHPNNAYATVGNTLVWELEAVVIDPLLGTGTPEIVA